MASALRDVWAAWWDATLHTHPSPVLIRETLGLISVATNSLRPWLNIWTATHHPAADAHLADLVDDVMFEFEITDLHMGFYGDTTPLRSCWAGSSPMYATAPTTLASAAHTSLNTIGWQLSTATDRTLSAIPENWFWITFREALTHTPRPPVITRTRTPPDGSQ
ncbi:hypothetical protein ACH4VM_39890 [Streptomyces sp. NPDC020792]|uniref:hypothetical protein n=1 Tax=Streptomyces sp. NPDC020792 TaxID=3365089 RepID=UPI0037B68308